MPPAPHKDLNITLNFGTVGFENYATDTSQ